MKNVLSVVICLAIMAISVSSFAQQKQDMFYLSDHLGKPLSSLKGCKSVFMVRGDMHHCVTYDFKDKVFQGAVLSVTIEEGVINNISASFTQTQTSISKNSQRMMAYVSMVSLACGSTIKEEKEGTSMTLIYGCNKYAVGLNLNEDMISVGFFTLP